MNWYKLSQIDAQSLANKYPKANGISGDLIVDNDVPNTNSISASLKDYEEIRGIRNIPISEFYLTGISYSIEEDNHIKKIEEQIKQSKHIKPLIVVMDKKGLYILEGGHRAEALYNLKATYVPSLLIVDLENYELV